MYEHANASTDVRSWASASCRRSSSEADARSTQECSRLESSFVKAKGRYVQVGRAASRQAAVQAVALIMLNR